MKPRVVISIPACHTYSYRSMDKAFMKKFVEKHAPEGYDGLEDSVLPWEGESWDVMFDNKDPRCFQHILKDSVTSRGFEASLIAFLHPAFHLDNEGFAAWYRVAYSLSAYHFLNKETLNVQIGEESPP